MMNTKHIGFIIIGISILLLLVMFSFIRELQETAISQCGCVEGACPMETTLPIEGYIGITLSAIIGIVGVGLVFTSKKKEKIAIMKSERIKKMLKTLNADEKKIYNLIESSGDVIFQGDLVDKSGFSKVKVSRILDKLESKGLVERRRRGMSNILLTKKA